MRPEAQGLKLGGGARVVFGARVVAGFLGAKGVKAKRVA
jgi:hypothetical protein